MDTKELIKRLRSREAMVSAGAVIPKGLFGGAADTIERLHKDLAEKEALYMKYYDLAHNCSIQLRHAHEQRVAALVELERLKARDELYR